MSEIKPRYELRIVSSDIIFLKALEYNFHSCLVEGKCKLKELKQ